MGYRLPDDLKSLVERCLARDTAAMAEFVRRFQGMLYGLCFKMLGHREDAEDMVQESFLRAFRSLGRWDATRDLQPWLMAIAGNRCRTFLSSRKRKHRPLELEEEVADKSSGPSDAGFLAEEIRQGLEKLRPDYRAAFLLFHDQHLSYAEIAEALDRPIGTVKTWVHRARLELADTLKIADPLKEPSREV